MYRIPKLSQFKQFDNQNFKNLNLTIDYKLICVYLFWNNNEVGWSVSFDLFWLLIWKFQNIECKVSQNYQRINILKLDHGFTLCFDFWIYMI